MEINIKPEDIDNYVKDAILKCTIGKKVKESVEKCIDELFSSYRSPIQEFVKQEIRIMVAEFLKSEETRPKILAAIAKGLAPDTIELIVSNAAHDLQERIKNRND